MAVWQWFVIGYLGLVNIVAFFLRGWDKRQAVGKKRRIPEKTLLMWSTVGGWLGALLGMQLFRHKTIKGKFLRWFYGIVVLWIIFVIILLTLG